MLSGSRVVERSNRNDFRRDSDGVRRLLLAEQQTQRCAFRAFRSSFEQHLGLLQLAGTGVDLAHDRAGRISRNRAKSNSGRGSDSRFRNDANSGRSGLAERVRTGSNIRVVVTPGCHGALLLLRLGRDTSSSVRVGSRGGDRVSGRRCRSDSLRRT